MQTHFLGFSCNYFPILDWKVVVRWWFMCVLGVHGHSRNSLHYQKNLYYIQVLKIFCKYRLVESTKEVLYYSGMTVALVASITRQIIHLFLFLNKNIFWSLAVITAEVLILIEISIFLQICSYECGIARSLFLYCLLLLTILGFDWWPKKKDSSWPFRIPEVPAV